MTMNDSTADKLDRLLRRDAQVALPDDGFTARVMLALPAQEATHHAWLTPVLILGSAALGSALAIAFAPAGANVVQGFFDIVVSRSLTPAAVAGLGMTAALLLSAIVLALDTE
jgi:hypothetical protein